MKRIAAENRFAIRTLYCQLLLKEGTGLTLHGLLAGLSESEIEQLLTDDGELSLLSRLYEVVLAVLPSTRSDPDWNRNGWKEMRPLQQWIAERFEPVMDLVLAGAACEVAKRDTLRDTPMLLLDRESPAWPDRPPLVFEGIVQMAIHVAILQGDPDRAMRLLLSTLQFGRDCLDDPDPRVSLRGSAMIGWMSSHNLAVMTLAEGEIPTNSLHREFVGMMGIQDAEKGNQLEHQLAGLARPLPSRGFSIKYGLACFGRALLRHESENPVLRSHLFRRMMTDLMQRSSNYGPEQLSHRVGDARDGEIDTFRQMQSQYLPFALLRSESVQSDRLEVLLNLRVALKSFLLASDRDHPVEDPYGDVLHSMERKGMTYIWSNGEDGVNDGGDGLRDWVYCR